MQVPLLDSFTTAFNLIRCSSHLFKSSRSRTQFPIHLQLAGPLTSLRQLFRDPPATETSIVVVSVSIQRQIAVDVGGSRSWREFTIGEGKMMSVPPAVSQLEFHSQDEEVLDWEGELRAKPDVAVSGFVAAGVIVKVIPPFMSLIGYR